MVILKVPQWQLIVRKESPILPGAYRGSTGTIDTADYAPRFHCSNNLLYDETSRGSEDVQNSHDTNAGIRR